MTDGFGRNIDYLRISVTDKCNLRCRYCMPAEGVCLLPHEEILTLEEITRITRIMAGLGVRKIRLTGGEPLIRKNFVKLVEDIHKIDGIDDVAITTNGVLFSKMATDLKKAGLKRVNLSLDTLNPQKFTEITGADSFFDVKNAINAAIENDMKLKINCVACCEFNESELSEIAFLAKENPIDVRFIELMPIGSAKNFTGIPTDEILKKLESRFGKSTQDGQQNSVNFGNLHGESTAGLFHDGPAEYVRFEGFLGKVGFISPISHKFCASCNRVRLTADGKLKLCLQYDTNLDLKTLLRGGKIDEEIGNEIRAAIKRKPAEHSFSNMNEKDLGKIDNRRMVQIGG